MSKRKTSLSDGFLRKNAVLSEGMVIAPVVVCCDTVSKALLVSLAFVCITFPAVVIGSFLPKKMVYAARVILYALIAAALYIPTAMLCQTVFPGVYATLGVFPTVAPVLNAALIYLPLLSVNSFIVLHSELHFYQLRRPEMLVSLLSHCAGFCLTACVCGLIREILAYGSIAGHIVDMPLLLRGFAAPWAGFIVLGILCALHRRIFRKQGD